MQEDDEATPGQSNAQLAASSERGEQLDHIADLDDEDVPTISDEMLHHERIDFEAGMNAVPPVTMGLTLACAAVYLRQVWIGGLNGPDRVVATGGMDRGRVLAGEFWRMISAGFMHASAEHLIGNMVMLYVLGMACEHGFGRGAFLFLFVACCWSGSLLAMTSGHPEVGASGAIFGLAGALIVMIRLHRKRIELRDHRVSVVLAVWAAYALFLGFFDPIVSNSSHIGGLLGGSILGFFLAPAILTDRGEPDDRLIPKLETGVAILVLSSTFLLFLPHLRELALISPLAECRRARAGHRP